MWSAYAITAAALVVVATVGARATDIGPWYRELKKPSWNPPDWAFPVVWTTIYVFIVASVGRAWNAADEGQQTLLVVLVVVNLLLNMLWSVLFFSWRRPRFALIEVVILDLSIVAIMIYFMTIDRVAALLLLPYLLWVSVASVLNFTIVRLNPEVS